MTIHVITYDEATDVMSCTCGNVPSTDGFVSCDEQTHQECEPDGYWCGRYLCQSCGATFVLPSVKAIATLESAISYISTTPRDDQPQQDALIILNIALETLFAER